MEEQEKNEKKKRGRPKSSTMKVYGFKADGDLIPLLDDLKASGGRNRFLNDAIREKAVRDGLRK